MYCGGEGFLEDFYGGGKPCPGCGDCDSAIAADERAEELDADLAEYRACVPLWAGETVYDFPRRPALPELPADFTFIHFKTA